MKLSFGLRVIGTTIFACLICTIAAIVVARNQLQHKGEQAIVDKSQAILSRLEVARGYMAKLGGLGELIKDTIQKYPDGKLPEDVRMTVLRRVPIYAALELGKEGAEEEHYQFRVFSDEPRKKENLATSFEKGLLSEFAKSSELKEIVTKTTDGDSVMVVRPVRLSEKQGCLHCHGEPGNSPWKNGKDILGYPMENWSDGKLHAGFAVISSLGPMRAEMKAATSEIIFWGIGFTVLAVLVALVAVRKSIRQINSSAQALRDSGEKVSGGASELTTVSHGLSSSSNEAAASLEETVSSLEELASMVARNSENATEAASLSVASRESAAKGETEIRELISAMGEISQGAKRMEDIINVIDGIAFQTNLLALNAAVEAARAGEQGKGFAVVAEAVRNLAQRSSEAAKEITVLIKDSSQRVERGTEIAASSNQVLGEIVNSVKKVADLNNEIAIASQEQRTGLDQISKAMNQLDQVTQSNAASAEEAAASAEVMSGQAGMVEKEVAKLFDVLQGHHDARVTPKSAGSKDGNQSSDSSKVISMRKKTSKTEAAQLIPFEEGDAPRKVGTTKDF